MIFARLNMPPNLQARELQQTKGHWFSADLDPKDLNSVTELQINHNRTERLCHGNADNKERRDSLTRRYFVVID